jgi:nucleoside-diphosphate-sugar epimerase
MSSFKASHLPFIHPLLRTSEKMVNNGLLVLTGATGFVGFKTLITALKAGYEVRIVVRSSGKGDAVLEASFIKALKLGSERLSYFVVPDIAAPGAYDDAVKGATYVIHCASPIPSFGDAAPTPEFYDEFFVQTARKATIGLLESIRKAGTIKRVIITSSIAGIIPLKYFIGQGDNEVFNAENRTTLDPGPYSVEFQAYSASKVAALNASEAWVKENSPNFDLISVLPGWVFGRDELCTAAADFKTGSTNSVLLGLLTGSRSDDPMMGNMSFVDDVAQVHIRSLDPKVEGNQAFIVTSDGIDGAQWEDATETVRKCFPEALSDGRLKSNGKQPTAVVRVDAGKTEKTFGIHLTSFEGQVKSLVSQYLDVTKP